MKIFAYVGSNKKNNSNTMRIVQKLIDNISYVYKENVEYKIYSAADVNIIECQGCNSCFLTGKCSLEDKDDMKKIKKEILDSDVIIWGSPSYAHNVSSSMKKLIDRLASLLHHMAFCGKMAMVVTSSTGTGNDKIERYLKDMFIYFGAYYIGAVHDYCGFLEKNIGKNEDKDIELLAKKCVDIYENVGIKSFENFEIYEKIYEMYKSHYLQYEANKDEVYEVYKWIKEYGTGNQSYEEHFVEKFNKLRG